MSTLASLAIAGSQQETTRELLEGLWLQVSAALWRYFEQLPERYEDVDPTVFARVPVPV
jgi:hypothetical protein